jgi:hypothetical protein
MSALVLFVVDTFLLVLAKSFLVIGIEVTASGFLVAPLRSGQRIPDESCYAEVLLSTAHRIRLL